VTPILAFMKSKTVATAIAADQPPGTGKWNEIERRLDLEYPKRVERWQATHQFRE